MNKNIQGKLKLIPHNPGVYLMKNKKGSIIYVGKANDLKKRVSSYFTRKSHDLPRTEMLVNKIQSFDYIVTRSEIDALILEDTLIKKHRPKFNVSLKDDKRYPYLKITIKESFPRVIVTRKLQRDGSKYFGPYTEARSLRNTLQLLEKIFRLKTCNKSIPRQVEKTDALDRACLNYQIGKCDAPCIGNISYEDYRERIRQVILFLKGKTESVIREITSEMEKAVKHQEFEKASEIRDRIKEITQIARRQIVSNFSLDDQDVVGVAKDGKNCCVVVLKIRDGKMIKKEHYFLENAEDESYSIILSRFCMQYYTLREDIPRFVNLQYEPEDRELIEELFKFAFHIPQRGDKKKLLDMAKNNAFLLVEEKKLAHLKSSQRTVFAVKELKDTLHLSNLPRRIAAFDVSNLYGEEAVASMVFFDNGKPKKKQYRRFKIKHVPGIDDYKMMHEAVTRYVAHLNDEGVEMPDLILIDGGKGQLSAASRALSEKEYTIPLYSIAKRLEEIFKPGKREPIIIPKTSYALKLLQQIRNEAHRFAITYHKTLRDRKTNYSELDTIPGIGEKKKMLLLSYFGSVERIKKATIEDLLLVPGISNITAEVIKRSLKSQ
ncbi:MAG TPA: excinuclease ABC subunit UvrC [Candidatus Cloacimonetes bacterium]|nr:excinuclease ABC subunit UvrC [Candidatus Cloacimonadota bacterium]HEX38260.1 excinuclease ABC subunit UvrC [Candidatus Cloacimonadota bacterium]